MRKQVAAIYNNGYDFLVPMIENVFDDVKPELDVECVLSDDNKRIVILNRQSSKASDFKVSDFNLGETLYIYNDGSFVISSKEEQSHDKSETDVEHDLSSMMDDLIDGFDNSEKSKLHESFKDIESKVRSKAETLFGSVKTYGSNVKSQLEQRVKERQEKEDRLYDALRASDDYAGLSDDELRSIVKKRLFFSQF